MNDIVKKILKLDLALLVAYFLFRYFIISPEFIVNFLGIALFFTFGINAALLIQLAFKKKFDFFEFLSIAALSSLVIFPTLLIFENALLHIAYDWLPIANIISITLLIISLYAFSKNKSAFEVDIDIEKRASYYVFSCFAIIAAIIISLVIFSYPQLPDLDPYTWLLRYKNQFNNNVLPDISARPLFSALIFIFSRLAKIEIFSILKYVLPYLFISVLLPIWLVARNYPSKLKRVIFLTLAFAAPNTVLYSLEAMPQMPFIFLSFYFSFFLLYSYLKRDDFYFYLAGITAMGAILYHEAAIIIFLIWLIVALYINRKKIFFNKTQLVLITLLIISSHSIIQNYVAFSYRWISRILSILVYNPKINVLFPSKYINVDGNSMGWQGLSGITKYYAFYAGPMVFGILFIFILLHLKKEGLGKFIFRKTFNNPSLLVLFLSFLTFFSIAEILPRFPGIAMLPDRAWIFAGIFFSLFIFLIFEYDKEKPILKKLAYVFLLLMFITSLGGALYTNNLKKYLITTGDMKSAQWIKANLPKDRVFFSTGKKNVLEYYAQSKIISVPSKFYFDSSVDNSIETINYYAKMPSYSEASYKEYIGNINSEIRKAASRLTKSRTENTELELYQGLAQKNKDLSENFLHSLEGGDVNKKKIKQNDLYIFYSEMSKNNPYANRPYKNEIWGIKRPAGSEIIFDKYPERFEKIYEDKENGVMIWKIL